MTEVWKPVPGFEERYEVSDLGRVRSLDQKVRGAHGLRSIKGRLLRPGVGVRDQKAVVALGAGNTMQVHVLVLLAFVGPRPPGMDGCHGPGGSLDNRLDNLRWDTRSENNRDVTRAGERNLTYDQVEELRRRVAAGDRKSFVAREYGINWGQLHHVVQGRQYVR